MSDSATVFVVDDDAAARESVCTLVRSHGAQAQGFASAQAFLLHYETSRRGCLVLDLRMPGMSGDELQERLVAEGIQIPVIVTTGHADVPTAVRVMRFGARTVLEKPYRHDELWREISGALAQAGQQQERLSDRVDIAGRLPQLTQEERRVLELIAAGELNKVIAKRLGVSLRTVERERARVFAKLEVRSVAELVRKVSPSRGKEL